MRNSATPVFYIGPNSNVIECTKDVFRLFSFEFEFLNPFELSSIRPDSGSVKGGKFVSVHEKSNNLVAFNGVIGL